MAWFHQPRAQILRFYGLIMLWNEFRIHKTSKLGLFVNEIKPIKFIFIITSFLFSSLLSNYYCTFFWENNFFMGQNFLVWPIRFFFSFKLVLRSIKKRLKNHLNYSRFKIPTHYKISKWNTWHKFTDKRTDVWSRDFII